MSLPSILGGAAGGAYGASRGPQAIRRVLDTERTAAFVAVLAVSVLVAALSGWSVVAVIVSHEPRDRATDVVALVMLAVLGLLLLAACRMACDVVLRWWWRGRRSGRVVDAVAPSGVAATAVLRSRAALVVPFLVGLLITSYGVGLAVLATGRLGAWWALPFVAVGAWGLCYLTPFLLGRVRAGGVYLTPAAVEHRWGTVTGNVRWTGLGAIGVHTPFALCGATVTRSFPWNLPGDPTDYVSEPGCIGIPLTYLALAPANVAALLTTYVEQPHLREFLGTPAPREWTDGTDPIDA